MLLSTAFLEPYYTRGDVFPNLLARSVYLSKYKRPEDTCWTDTIARVVRGNCALENVSETEAERLFDLFWTMQALPPGRGLWTGGTNLPVESRYNCAYVTLRSVADWGYIANLLMCGCGVGVGLQRIYELPRVTRGSARLGILCSRSHPNRGEVMPDEVVPDIPQHLVEDTRQGWVTALEAVLTAAFAGSSIVVNVSGVRPRGALIRTFGGVACGPGPLVTLLRSAWTIVRKAAGYRLRSLEALDVTNHIGLAIKSGNVRRSALIQLGEADDDVFRRAKQDDDAVLAHRHTSNNSVVIETALQLERFDWGKLITDNARYGEPGVLNLWKIRQTDPNAEGINPCFRADTLIHTRQGHFQIRDLVDKTVDVWDGKSWRNVNTFRVTSKNEPMLRFTLQDGSSFAVTHYHKIVTVDGRRIDAKDVEVGERLLVSNAPEAHGEIHCDEAYSKGFSCFSVRLPSEVFAWNLESKLAFIDGVIDAGGNESQFRCRLEDFQTLLKTVGTKSRLVPEHGYYRLEIGQSQQTTFNEVALIENDGIDEDVFCLVTDDPDQIACSNGLIIGRCGEIPLHDREFCCLAEVYPARCTDVDLAMKLVTRYTLRQRLEPVTDLIADQVRAMTMRIGVGLGGVCDFDWESDTLARWYRAVRNEADYYAAELGVARPIAVTTVKPSGTISKLNGSSPGIHAPHAPFYIQRTRLAINDPMAAALTLAGVPCEPCVYDSSGQTLVFSFPMRGREVSGNTAVAQLRRQHAVQTSWADNAVSCTVTFAEDEVEALVAELGKLARDIKSISCLPASHSYAQPPYEKISAGEYQERMAAVDADHPLVTGGDIDIQECEAGVCPVR